MAEEDRKRRGCGHTFIRGTEISREEFKPEICSLF